MNRNIIYHITNNPIQIKRSGLRPEENISELPSDDVYIQDIAQKNELDYPINRRKANFFFPNLDSIPYDYNTAHIVAVDVSKINRSMYVADRDLRDSVIWDKSEESAVEYVKSISKVQHSNDIRHIDGTPELIIHGNIATEHIVAVERGKLISDVLKYL